MPRRLKKAKDDHLEKSKVSEKGKATSNNNQLESYLESLKSSKTSRHSSISGFFTKKDSSEYQAVVASLEAVLMHTRTSFNEDFRSNLEKLKNASNAYMKLIAVCETYLNKSGGKSETGQARKESVKEVLYLAKQDLHGITQYYGDIRSQTMSEEQQEMLEWKDILHDARTETLEMDDYYGEKDVLGSTGGRKFEEGVFFKEEISETHGNLTNKNIAYGRIANLIGVGGIVEQSKQVKVHDKTSNEVISGAMMTWAKGEEAQKIANNLAKEVKDKESLADKESVLKGKIAPSLQKELCSLQVLDYICDQDDRHLRNFFIEKDGEGKEEKYSHVHGIDHDHSFYKKDNSAKKMNELKNEDKIERSNTGQIRGSIRVVVDQDGKLCIPHMDKKLAANIKSINVNDLVFVLEDLMDGERIGRVANRLVKLQSAIKEAEKENPEIFLEDGQWGKESHDRLLENSFDYQVRAKGKNPEKNDAYKLAVSDNYYARFWNESLGY